MLDLGPAQLSRITDLDRFALPLGFFMPDADVAELRPHADTLAPHHFDFETNEVLLGLHSLLLRVGGLNILIDTCVGECKPRPRRADWHDRKASGYLEALAAQGLRPEDVDIVLCTHLHADHVGWNTRLSGGRWVPTFPNARYLIGRSELAHWQSEEARRPGHHNHGAYADSVLPVIEAGQVETVDDGFALARGLTILPLPGHSPGQVGLSLMQGRQTQAIFCGDAIHSPLQVYRPDYNSAFCADPALAARVRAALIRRAEEEGCLLIPAHLRHAAGMRVTRAGAGHAPVMIAAPS